MTIDVSDADIRELVLAIKHAQPLSARKPNAREADLQQPVVGNARDKFCSLWPAAREGLVLLQEVAVVVPAAGFLAKKAIGTAITLGDAAKEVLCG